MSITLEAVVADALQLAPGERAELIERLVASVEPAPSLHPDWDAEIARRVAALDAGVEASVPAEQVFSDIRNLIEKHERPA